MLMLRCVDRGYHAGPAAWSKGCGRRQPLVSVSDLADLQGEPLLEEKDKEEGL